MKEQNVGTKFPHFRKAAKPQKHRALAFAEAFLEADLCQKESF